MILYNIKLFKSSDLKILLKGLSVYENINHVNKSTRMTPFISSEAVRKKNRNTEKERDN